MWYIDWMAHRERFSLVLGARGRIVLPAKVRKRLGIEEGDALVLVVEDGGRVSISSLRDRARKCRGLFSGSAPGRSPAAELLDERAKERS
jgi:AbrB family looped-hinge helix DNA binding protein